MGDRLRTDTSDAASPATAVDRDTRIEQLLLDGLDQYFAGAYERAISVWTRVLFLDRSHRRAHAYIERARSAIAERQRESEELVQRGMAAFENGDADGARRLLTSAVEHAGPHDVALAFLGRLDRLEAQATPGDVAAGEATPNAPAAGGTPTAPERRRRPAPLVRRMPRRRIWFLPVITARRRRPRARPRQRQRR